MSGLVVVYPQDGGPQWAALAEDGGGRLKVYDRGYVSSLDLFAQVHGFDLDDVDIVPPELLGEALERLARESLSSSAGTRPGPERGPR